MAPPTDLRQFQQAPEKLPLGKRLWNTFMTNPIAFVGGAGTIGMASYAAYNFKNRKSSASMYIMHYRVVAQFMFIGALVGGVASLVAYSAIMGDPRERAEKERLEREAELQRATDAYLAGLKSQKKE